MDLLGTEKLQMKYSLNVIFPKHYLTLSSKAYLCEIPILPLKETN